MPVDPESSSDRPKTVELKIFDKGLRDWRKERKQKKLYELQIEVCEKAIKEVRRAPRLSAATKESVVKAIQLEMDELKKTKRPFVRIEKPFEDEPVRPFRKGSVLRN